jgi:branched-chain amino acid transport system substrate-binding protein
MSDEIQVNPEEPESGRVSRRKFLGGVAGAGIGGLALAGILAACGESNNEAATTTGGATTAGGEEPAPTTAAGQTAANTNKPIVVGSPYPTTTSDGKEMQQGSDLAIQEINDKGGVAGRTIEHEIVDVDVFDGESETQAFNDLVTKEVDAIAIGYVTVFEPMEILRAYGAPTLNASTSIQQVTAMRADPPGWASVFQADPTEVQYGAGFPAFLNNLIAAGTFKPPTKTIFIFEGDIVYSTTISKAAQDAAPDAGWEVVGIEPIAGSAGPVTDWTTQIQKAKDSKASVVFNTHWNPADHAALMKQWAADPPDAFLYLQYGASVPEFLEISGDAANGVVWATVLGTMNDAVGKAFQERYQTKWGGPAGFSNAGTGYDELYMLAHAWGITGDPRNFDAMNAELKRNIYRGVSGGYWFNSEEANFCLCYPVEQPDPGLGNPHLFFQILPDDSGKLAHTIIQPAPYVQSPYVQQPWLSF